MSLKSWIGARLSPQPPVRTPSWSVVSTVADHPKLLQAFAAHYLSIGAQEVWLFIDNPAQEGLDLLQQMDGVRLTVCDDAYWARSGRARPAGQEGRQIHNVNLAYADCPTDWLFFCDVDEYLMPQRAVTDVLAEIPADTVQCRPHMSERVFDTAQPQGLFDGRIKRPIPKKPKVLEAAFGDLASFTTGGLLGHVIGKTFTRTGRDDLRLRLHMAVPKDPAVEKEQRRLNQLAPGPRMEGLWLVHYDGLTPLHWKLKLLRYAQDYQQRIQAGEKNPFAQRLPARLRQIRHVYDRLDTAYDMADLMPLLQPGEAALDRLKKAGGLLDQAFDPLAAVKAYGLSPADFSAEAFDRDLRRQKADLVARYNL